MSLPLPITFEQNDYTYKVLTCQITRDATLIKIELNGKEYELTKTPDNHWQSDVTIAQNVALLAAIARNISLRYWSNQCKATPEAIKTAARACCSMPSGKSPNISTVKSTERSTSARVSSKNSRKGLIFEPAFADQANRRPMTLHFSAQQRLN
ncbi:hypothetical protein [Pedobacter deserti]|uniref:hypothetical protein n=1 Tax=Pedobacter deserti TaxID=2817382 RepID=UPI00210D2FC9|nr:hypothetical protein [Pedobacter sp. SYSU D00382]